MSALGRGFQNSSQPSWTCWLDGNYFSSNNVSWIRPVLNVNTIEMCSFTDIVPKATPSNFTVVASGTTETPFLFDYIQYVPDARTILDNATVAVDGFDPQIEYFSGWSITPYIGLMGTSVQGSHLIFDFVGAPCL